MCFGPQGVPVDRLEGTVEPSSFNLSPTGALARGGGSFQYGQKATRIDLSRPASVPILLNEPCWEPSPSSPGSFGVQFFRSSIARLTLMVKLQLSKLALVCLRIHSGYVYIRVYISVHMYMDTWVYMHVTKR